MKFLLLVFSVTLATLIGLVNRTSRVIVTEAADCRVMVHDIAGSYEGDCHKGKAHGMGKAIGKDTYEGEFKKGYPDGEGTYTWINGDYFEGTFVKGQREGEGKMVYASVNADSILTGYWEDDLYQGAESGNSE
ncbi:MAG: hypothetical protein ACFB15_02005 [Cyclobacteriaceae bacterium]